MGKETTVEMWTDRAMQYAKLIGAIALSIGVTILLFYVIVFAGAFLMGFFGTLL